MKKMMVTMLGILLLTSLTTAFAANDHIDLIKGGKSSVTIKKDLKTFKRIAMRSSSQSFGIQSVKEENSSFFAAYQVGTHCYLGKSFETHEKPPVIKAGTKISFLKGIKNDSAGSVRLFFENFKTLDRAKISIWCHGNYLNYAGTMTDEVEEDLSNVVDIDI